jgi:lipopolysaccharide/colanic/teichoic acid biosynthesis glycosyltransferase
VVSRQGAEMERINAEEMRDGDEPGRAAPGTVTLPSLLYCRADAEIHRQARHHGTGADQQILDWDLKYIRECSVAPEAKILFATLWLMLTRLGAF